MGGSGGRHGKDVMAERQGGPHRLYMGECWNLDKYVSVRI